MGCQAVGVAAGLSGEGTADGGLSAETLSQLHGLSGVVSWADKKILSEIRQALADRDGSLLPLISATDMEEFCVLERHLCIDTTASGGNAQLLSGS